MKKITKAAAAITSVLATSIAAERMLTKKEKKGIHEYGTKITCSHGNMNTLVMGVGKETIVMLSGYGTASPILDYTPLANCLAQHYRVVILEYLGYGCSDDTDVERSVETICEEIHEALSNLGMASYWLMPHSLSGVYALAYANMYTEEVKGILAIDTSIPKQNEYVNSSMDFILSMCLNKTGLTRLFTKVKSDRFLPPKDVYGKTARDQIRRRMLQHSISHAIKNEGKRINENLMKCKEMQFPDIPVLMFISDSNIQMTKGWWKTLHEEQLEGITRSELITLHGSHYLHWTNSESMAEAVQKFIEK